MKITEHFDLWEFHQQEGRGEPMVRYPSEWVQERLYPLCRILEKIREACGARPITITSGYRSPAYNAKCRGAAKNSQHMYGRAADIQVHGLAADKVHEICRQLHADGTVKIPGLGQYPSFTHVDIREGLARWGGKRMVDDARSSVIQIL